jgi:hypothetical protein
VAFRALAFNFHMGKTTIAAIVYETCSAIWSELVNIHMAPPSQDDLKNIASDYYRLWQFPHCIGALDGKHVKSFVQTNQNRHIITIRIISQ